jgi:hypothetical protein
MADNAEARVTKRMKLNSQCINHIRISGDHSREFLTAHQRKDAVSCTFLQQRARLERCIRETEDLRANSVRELEALKQARSKE